MACLTQTGSLVLSPYGYPMTCMLQYQTMWNPGYSRRQKVRQLISVLFFFSSGMLLAQTEDESTILPTAKKKLILSLMFI